MKMWRFFVFLVTLLAVMPISAIEIQGHRGARAIYPENSIVGFEYAIKHSDVLELDLHLNGDGNLVITHDPVILERCVSESSEIQERIISELTQKEIAQFDCGSVRDEKGFPKILVPGTKIPLLEDLLNLVENTGSEIRLNIEIKYASSNDQLAFYPERQVLVDKLINQLNDAGFLERVTIQSFDREILILLKEKEIQIGKQLRIAFLYTGKKAWPYPVPRYEDALKFLIDNKIEIFSPNFELMTSWLYSGSYKKHIQSNIEKYGFRVVPWTINGVENWEKILKYKIHGIITDDPEGLRKHLDSN